MIRLAGMMIQNKSGFEDGSPKYQQIADAIRRDIIDHNLKPGDSLPTVRAYAERIGVSPSMVTRAYSALERDGFVETIQGKGSTVSYLQGELAPEESNIKVFWSYAHRDDELTHGAIQDLAQDVANSFEVQMGRKLDVFFDRKSIKWGDNWRTSIEANLGKTLFFIPVISPTYLRRPSCLGELKRARKAFHELHLDAGIYPLQLVDVSPFLEASHDDDLASFLADTQAKSLPGGRTLYELFNKGQDSADYRDSVYDIAMEIKKRDASLGQNQENLLRDLAVQEKSLAGQGDQSKEPGEGLLDLLPRMADFQARLEEAMGRVSSAASQIGETFQKHPLTGRSFAERYQSVESISSELDRESKDLLDGCDQYRKIIDEYDSALQETLSFYDMAVATGLDVSAIDLNGLDENLSKLGQLADSFAQLRQLIGMVQVFGKLSRKLREPCERIERALDMIVDSQNSFERWQKAVRERL